MSNAIQAHRAIEKLTLVECIAVNGARSDGTQKDDCNVHILAIQVYGW